MAIEQKTVQQLNDDIISQLEAALSQTIPILPKSFSRVSAKVLAGVFVLLYKYASWIFLQIYVLHASMEETVVFGKRIRPLVEFGRLIGVGDPEPAVRAELTVAITVHTQGDSLAGQTQLVRSESGVVYHTQAAVDLDDATVQVAIIAVSDSSGGLGEGEIGNLAAGDTLQIANGPGTIASEVTVVSLDVVGAEEENVDSYRQKIIDRVQKKPQGGAYADYFHWGKEVTGVANIFPYSSDNPGEVDVYVEADTVLDPDGIPDAALLTAVLENIELNEAGLATRRPVNGAVNVLPITRTAFSVRVRGLVAPSISVAQDAITEGLDEYLRTRKPYIVGLSVPPREDRIIGIEMGGIVSQIVNALLGSVTDVELLDNGDAIPAYSLSHGELAKLDTPIDWV